MKRALITGITGQDGSYLAELLLSHDYEVHGIRRQSSSPNTGRLEPILAEWNDQNTRLFLHFADLTDTGSLMRLLTEIRPDEIYNLAAQSHIGVSLDIPEYSCDVTGMGALRILEMVHRLGLKSRFFQASSCEMFSFSPLPQNEKTPFYPRNPYAYSKVFAHNATVNYRERYGILACCGILFNHESPRRGEEFVTQKIARAVARIKMGLQRKLLLQNLDGRRDWGLAPDYVEAMWLMLQQDEPDDYVIGTGKNHSVGELVDLAFQCVGLDWQEYVELDAKDFSPAAVYSRLADPTKAREKLKWRHKTEFPELVEMMVNAAIEALEKATLASKASLVSR